MTEFCSALLLPLHIVILCLLHCSIDGEVVGLQVPMMAARFTGTGDLFTSLYLAWSEHGVKVSTVHTVHTVCAGMVPSMYT